VCANTSISCIILVQTAYCVLYSVVSSHRNKALPPLPTSSHHGPLPPIPKKGPVVPPHKKPTMNNDHSAVATPFVSAAPVPPAKPAHKTRGSYEHASPNSVLSQPLPNLPSAAPSPTSNKQPAIPPVSQPSLNLPYNVHAFSNALNSAILYNDENSA